MKRNPKQSEQQPKTSPPEIRERPEEQKPPPERPLKLEGHDSSQLGASHEA
jgi:hypothetical protein